MQSMPDTRQQSFDEIYGPPENFLEIEVRMHIWDHPSLLMACMVEERESNHGGDMT